MEREEIDGVPHARLDNVELKTSIKAFENDAFARLKIEYELAGTDRSNLAYRCIAKEASGMDRGSFEDSALGESTWDGIT